MPCRVTAGNGFPARYGCRLEARRPVIREKTGAVTPDSAALDGPGQLLDPRRLAEPQQVAVSRSPDRRAALRAPAVRHEATQVVAARDAADVEVQMSETRQSFQVLQPRISDRPIPEEEEFETGLPS